MIRSKIPPLKVLYTKYELVFPIAASYSGYRYDTDYTFLYNIYPNAMLERDALSLCEKDGARLFRGSSIAKLDALRMDPLCDTCKSMSLCVFQMYDYKNYILWLCLSHSISNTKIVSVLYIL